MAVQRLITGIFTLFILILSSSFQQAQSPDLPVAMPVEAEVSTGQEQTWQMTLLDGAVYTFQVEALDDDFDPVLRIYGINNRLIIESDDVAYPANTNALLEAFTVPQNGRYLIGVSGYEDSSGAFRLLVQPGYGVLESENALSAESLWQVTASTDAEDVDAIFENKRLTINLTTADERAFAWYDESFTGAFYASIDVEILSDSAWQMGFVFEDDDNNHQLILELNHQGIWRTLLLENESTELISDWISHPAIIAGETIFNLAVLIVENRLTVIYNNQATGNVVDDRFANITRIGLMTGNTGATDNISSIAYDNFIVTTPDSEIPQFPPQVPAVTMADLVIFLQNQRLLPSGGVQMLDLADAPAQSLQPGVTRFSLMRGQRFDDFVLSSRLSWQINGEGTGGCGIILRSQSENQYTLAYADSNGSFGLAGRTESKFQPGLFTDNPALSQGGSPYELLIIGLDNQLHFYVEQHYIGVIETEIAAGAIGLAVVNFDAVNSSCRFQDTRLWSWE